MKTTRDDFTIRAAMIRSAGFTLIELLAVISILTLLISILLPALSSARQTAKAGVCLSQLKSIGNAAAIYLDENEDRFPPVRLERLSPTADAGDFFVNSDHRAAPRWQWFLETDLGPAISSVGFTLIPYPGGDFFYDGSIAGSGAPNGAMELTLDLFVCPTLADEDVARSIRDGAYGYNYQYLGNTYQEHMPGRWDNFAVGRHLIRNPANTVVIADSRGAGPGHGPHSFTLDPPRMATEARARAFGPRESDLDPPTFPGYEYPSTSDSIYAYSPMEPRHKKRGNVLFADMHAVGLTLVELGYEIGDGSGEDRPRGVAIPIRNPDDATYTATNKLWNGEGSDQIAYVHQPSGP